MSIEEIARKQLAEINQRIELGNERELEDDGSGDAVMSAWSMFAVVAQHDTPRLMAALTAVLDRHRPVSFSGWQKIKRAIAKLPFEGSICTACETSYPCAEVWAVADALEER